MTKRKFDEDPWVLYIVAKKHIKMSPGKLAAQVGHGVGAVYEFIYESSSKSEKENFQKWKNDARTKITLSVSSDEEFEEVKRISSHRKFIIADAGFTELEPGTETVIAFIPTKKSQRPQLLNNLKLY